MLRDYKSALVNEAATRLVSARLAHDPFDSLPQPCRPLTEAEAYAVQQVVHAQLTASGRGAVIGHKIGCTTLVMQEYLGVDNPCAGGVFRSTVKHVEGTFAQSEMLRIGMECELAVVLNEDLDQDENLSLVRLAAAVESVAAAIEVVEDRYVDYESLDTPTLIADDFFGAGCVLGKPRHDWREIDLEAVEASMLINGELVGRGAGRDILGHPFEALRWLAGARSRLGTPLRARECVLLGSLVQTQWVELGDVVVVRSPQLGEVTARVVSQPCEVSVIRAAAGSRSKA